MSKDSGISLTFSPFLFLILLLSPIIAFWTQSNVIFLMSIYFRGSSLSVVSHSYFMSLIETIVLLPVIVFINLAISLFRMAVEI